MDKNRHKDIRYLRMARVWSENSYAIRLKVGALIVSKEGNIISDGYNGTPSGFENVCEIASDKQYEPFAHLSDEAKRDTLKKQLTLGNITLITKPYVLHAEANALTKLARSTQSSVGATLYVTDMPCMECSKLIIQAGIRRVVYERPYRITDGIALLQRAGIEVVNIPTKVIDEETKLAEQARNYEADE